MKKLFKFKKDDSMEKVSLTLEENTSIDKKTYSIRIILQVALVFIAVFSLCMFINIRTNNEMQKKVAASNKVLENAINVKVGDTIKLSVYTEKDSIIFLNNSDLIKSLTGLDGDGMTVESYYNNGNVLYITFQANSVGNYNISSPYFKNVISFSVYSDKSSPYPVVWDKK